MVSPEDSGASTVWKEGVYRNVKVSGVCVGTGMGLQRHSSAPQEIFGGADFFHHPSPGEWGRGWGLEVGMEVWGWRREAIQRDVEVPKPQG